MKKLFAISIAFLGSIAGAQETADRIWFGGRILTMDDAAMRAEAPEGRVLLIGSSDAYGSEAGGAQPIRESEPLRPESPYARSKAAAELMGSIAAEKG